MKPHVLWAPSQNGFRAEWPQRQRAIEGFAGSNEKGFPSASHIVKVPSINNGPWSRTRIRVSDISNSLWLLLPNGPDLG